MVRKTEMLRGIRPAAIPFLLLLSALAGAQQATTDGTGEPRVIASSEIDAGRYLVVVGGCNDCHTGNWAESGGNVPESDWLTGVPVGFRGPWGTTYPSNLRLLVHEMDESQWVAMLRMRTDRPPMPWANLNRLNEGDARALYRYIRSLGNVGVRAPTALAPGEEPATPYIIFEPLHMERLSAASMPGAE